MSIPLLVRGGGADLRRVHAEGVRRRDRSRAHARGGAAGPVRGGACEPAVAADVPRRGGGVLRGPGGRSRVRQPGVPRAPARRAELPDLRAGQSERVSALSAKRTSGEGSGETGGSTETRLASVRELTRNRFGPVTHPCAVPG